MAKPATRVLAVLELLQAHGRISGAEMAARLGVDGRTLRRYIAVLEEAIGKPAILNVMPTQEGEMTRTEADVAETRAALGYDPKTPIDVGVQRFVDWYRDFYCV